MLVDQSLRAILDTTIDAVVVIDVRGSNLLFNRAADEMIGQSVNLLIPTPDNARHDEYIRRYLETGEAQVIGIGREVRALRRDGM